ncbi:MAG: GH92 family glycosyl hydrolase, partial [Kiritimatiellae bacterium]|nr:GH92 family glycosyl hydrolase [Kiritimatiellia bacterium]
ANVTNGNCHNCSQITNPNLAASSASSAPLRETKNNPVKKAYWLSAYAQIKDTLAKPHKGRAKERWDLLDKYGYYPFDKIRGESVSRTLECAYDDWCAGVMAEKLGFADDAAFFFRRSENWRNVFDASIGLVRGRDSNGKWREPYDPYALGHGADEANDFTEGNAFQYTWHVMQNPQGLVDAMGGRAAFVKKLDSLFEAPSKTAGMGEVLDVTGLIGQYVQGNEPSHHVIYFYPQVGHPEKAAKRIREVFDKFYLPKPDGLCGNDDCGQMSAWYIFSAMGFYPFNPCGGEYVIGAPQVARVELKIENGECRIGERKTFTMTARNFSRENKYVKSVTLNGKPIVDWKIRHSDIVSGGELVFEMGAAISLVSPADGAEVPLLKDRQKAFMRMPREKRAAYFNDKRPDMKKAIKTLRSAPRPVTLEWTGGRGPYKVTVTKRGSDGPWFCETVASNRVDVWNLEIAATYDWTVCADGECAKGWFRTEDQAPRLVCVPGVPNMRDIGGRVIGGRRVRQGLVYRSSGLNNNATTNAPGTARLTERWRKYMRDRLGIKTDIDLRSTRERFGMTCSPLGPDVKFVTMPTNYHGYAAIHTTGADDTRRVLRVFLDRANYPIDFHCIGGADRTGTVATILHGILGLDEDEIWKDYQITAWYGVVNDTHHLKRFKRLVDSFDRFEGATLSDRIRRYVLWLGFTESDMQTIRDIMFEGPSQEHGERGAH